MSEIKDITGQRFGRLVAIKQSGFDKYRKARWLCRCDCGQQKIVNGNELRCGNTRSCGCRKGKYKHGYSRHPLFMLWAKMIARCKNPNDDAYEYYGGRGIKVCKRWENFANFATDVGVRPKNRTLDRIDNDNHYKPSNWRWATRKEQNSNRRSRKRIDQFTDIELKKECKKRGLSLD